MRSRVIGFVCTLALLSCADSARAWNRAGHMVTGAIAHAVLKKDSPAALAKVVALLKKHPSYDKYWKQQVEMDFVPEADRELFLFMLAARWPDDARNDPKVYLPDRGLERWHYINLPFKPDGQPESVKTANPEDVNILRGFEENLAKVAGDAPEADRAAALSWVLHLIGDVHQPLHTSSLFTTQFQYEDGRLKGDRGGTRFYVRARPNGAVIHLHQFWDGLITGSDRFANTRNRAIELRHRDEFAREKLTELATPEFEKWATKESFPLAKDVAYRKGALLGSATRTAAPALPADYAATVQPIAERRAVLAGYRIAEVLRKKFE